MPKMLVWALVALVVLAGCKGLPPETPMAGERVTVGWGPEDMVLDDFGDRPRLLISCDDRREIPGRFAGIVSYDLETGQVDTLTRVEEPASLNFHPLGMDLVQIDDKLMLYVISIDENEGKHAVLKYQVEGQQLFWIQTFTSDLFRSPNGISAHGKHGFFLSNDRYNRNSFGEMALSKKKSQLVYCSAAGEARVVQDKIAFGNGVHQANGFLFQSALRGNHILRYRVAEDGSLSDRQEWAALKGPDNIRLHGDDLLVACHSKPFAFLGHMKKASKLSPTLIYRIPTTQKSAAEIEPEVVYCNKGNQISAGATGIIFRDKLYISQVYDPFILVVNLKEGK